MIKAIIFDCFGVIVGQGFANTYRAAGGDPQQDRDFINAMLGRNNLGLISDEEFRSSMAAKLGISLADWHQAVVTAEQPNAELLQYIKELRANYKTAILSNANVGSLSRRIGTYWLQACFDTVVVSAEVGILKPDPRIYRLTAERLEVKPEECVFVDDIELLAAAARAVGMQTIVYKNFAQLRIDLAKLLT